MCLCVCAAPHESDGIAEAPISLRKGKSVCMSGSICRVSALQVRNIMEERKVFSSLFACSLTDSHTQTPRENKEESRALTLTSQIQGLDVGRPKTRDASGGSILRAPRTILASRGRSDPVSLSRTLTPVLVYQAA